CIRGCTGRDSGPAHQVSEIRTEAPVGIRSCHGMTVDAGSAFENLPAGGYTCVLNGGLLLAPDPGGKVFGTVHRDPQQHLGVLYTAVPRTLAEKDSGVVRIHPHPVHGWEPDRSSPRVPGSRNCGRCQQKASSKM